MSVLISHFKVHCVELLKQVASSGRSLTVTYRHTPLVRIDPIAPKTAQLGVLRGQIEILGDIVGPEDAASLRDWDADDEADLLP